MKNTVKKNWEKADEVPVHEDLSQNLIKNYRPISLLLSLEKSLTGLHSIICLITLCKEIFYRIPVWKNTWGLMRCVIVINYTWNL